MIIAILAAMLLPALNKAKETAKSISCTNTISQYGKFTLLYISDNNDFFPYGEVDKTKVSTAGVAVSHFYNPNSVSCVLKYYFPKTRGGYGYIGEVGGTLPCPGTELKNRNFTAIGKYVNQPDTLGFLFFSYSVNGCIRRGNIDHKPIRVSRFRHPSQLFYWTDGSGQGAADYRCKWRSGVTKNGLNIPARHKGGANFCHADGSVIFIKWENYPSSLHGYETSPWWTDSGVTH